MPEPADTTYHLAQPFQQLGLPGEFRIAEHPARANMIWAIAAGLLLLSLANGSNDNFKGVATLWGSRVTSCHGAHVGDRVYVSGIGGGDVDGARAGGEIQRIGVGEPRGERASFLAAVVLGAAGTVRLASFWALPVSTTHITSGVCSGSDGCGVKERTGSVCARSCGRG